MKMQNNFSKKPDDDKSLLRTLLDPFLRVGNLLIVGIASIYYLFNKAVCAVLKKKPRQTYSQFVKSVESHLHTDVPSKPKAYKPSSSKTNAAPQQKSKIKYEKPAYTPINRQTSQKATFYKPKSSFKKWLPKLVMSVFAAGVVVTLIFIFTGNADNKQNQSNQLAASSSVLLLEETPQPSPNPTAVSLDEPEEVSASEPTQTPEEIAEAEETEAVDTVTSASATATLNPDNIDPEIMLHLDDNNDLVPYIQERLMDLHYMDADEPTDHYGMMTEYAIQLFQRGHDLMVDGVAGYGTLSLLFSDEATPYLVRKGDYGFDIYVIKNRLIELGYLDDDSTGKNFDEDTDYAIRVFQGRNKLSQDGIVGYNTTQVLFNGDAKPAKNYTPPSSGSSGGSSSGGSSASYDANSASDFVAFAKSTLNKGYTYVWGGKAPPGMDCSGFVYYCLNATGNSTGYKTSAAWAQSSYTTISSMSDVKPGDILCFDGHVAIAIGDGKMIDSSSSSNTIRIANFESSSYWNRKWICAKRFFG